METIPLPWGLFVAGPTAAHMESWQVLVEAPTDVSESLASNGSCCSFLNLSVLPRGFKQLQAGFQTRKKTGRGGEELGI